MKKYNRGYQIKRLVSIVLIIVMLPFSDFAYGEVLSGTTENEDKNPSVIYSEEALEILSDVEAYEETIYAKKDEFLNDIEQTVSANSSFFEELVEHEDAIYTPMTVSGNEVLTGEVETGNLTIRMESDEEVGIYSANLIVHGDLYVSGGCVKLYGTSVFVEGNVYFEESNVENNYSSSFIVCGELVIEEDNFSNTNNSKLVVGGNITLDNVTFENSGAAKVLIYQNLECNNSKFMNKYNGCLYTVMDCLIRGGKVENLDGTNTMICGDLIHESGKITLNNCELDVFGDYRMQKCIQTEEGITYLDSEAALKSTGDMTTIFVEGDCYIQSINEGMSNLLDKGRFILRGSLYQPISEENKEALIRGNLNTAYQYCFILHGDRGQTVEWNSETGSKQLGYFIIANQSEESVLFEGCPYVFSKVYWANQKKVCGGIRVGYYTQFDGAYFGGDLHTYSSLNMSKTLLVDGDLYTESSLSIYAPVKVMGDVYLDKLIYLNSDLYVQGDICITTKQNTSELIVSAGNAFVAGDIYCKDDTCYNTFSIDLYGADTSLEVCGEIKKGCNSLNISKGKMIAHNNLDFETASIVDVSTLGCLNLVSDCKQEIVLPQNANVRIGKLVVENTSEEGVVFNKPVSVQTLTNTDNCPIYFDKYVPLNLDTVSDNAVISEDVMLCGGSHTIDGESITFLGDVINIGHSILLEDGFLWIKGNLYNQSNIEINKGELLVEQDIQNGKMSKFTILNEKGKCAVQKDFIIKQQMYQLHMADGLLEIGGSFIQDEKTTFAFDKKSFVRFLLDEDNRVVLQNSQAKFGTILVDKSKKDRLHCYLNGSDEEVDIRDYAQEVVYEDEIPTGVSKITCTELTATSVKLEYTAAADNTGVEGYKIYRNDKFYDVTRDTVFVDNKVVPENGYTYRVYAYDSDGNLSKFSPICKVTTKRDNEPPTTPENVSYEVKKGCNVKLNWDEAHDNYKLEGYELYCNDRLLGRNSSTNYSLYGLETGDYTFQIYSYDYKYNKCEIPAQVTVHIFDDETPPEQVTGVRAYRISASTVTLRWTMPFDEFGVTSYEIYRDGGLIAKDITELNYKDCNLEKDHNYTYQIVAVDKAKNASTPSSALNVKTKNTQFVETYPKQDSKIGGDKVKIYCKISDTNALEENKVLVEYYDLKTDSYKQISDGYETLVPYGNSFSIFSRNWDISSLVEEQEIKLRYTFVDIDQNTLQKEISCYLDRTAPQKVAQINTKWDVNGNIVSYNASKDEDASYYKIYRANELDEEPECIAEQVYRTKYQDESSDNAKTYYYYVSCVDEVGNESELSEATLGGKLPDTQAPEKVTGLRVSKRTGKSITLLWNKGRDNYVVTGYNVYRDSNLIAANISETTYTDGDVNEESIYQYAVTALDEAGNESQICDAEDGAVFMPRIDRIEPQDYSTIGTAFEDIIVFIDNSGKAQTNQIKLYYRTQDAQEWNLLTEEALTQQRHYANLDKAVYHMDFTGFTEDVTIDIKAVLRDEEGCEDTEIVSYDIDRTPPECPGEVSATQLSGVVRLTWIPSVSADTRRYYIYRKEEHEDSYSKIADVTGRMGCYYVDRTVDENKTYEYVVTAVDVFGMESSESQMVKETVLADTTSPQIQSIKPNATKIGGKVTLEVECYDNRKVEIVEFYAKANDEEEWEYLSSVSTTRSGEDDIATYVFNTAPYPDGVYYIKIVAKDASGNENEESYLHRYTLDNSGPEKIILGDSIVGSTSVRLTWQDVSDEDFGYFLVEEYREAEQKWIEIRRTENELGVDINNLEPQSTHKYRVVGYDVLGNRGEESESIDVTLETDSISPRITKVSPVSSDYGDTMQLKFEATDNDFIKKGVFSYSTNGVDYEIISSIDLENPKKQAEFSYLWDTSEITEGLIYVKFNCYDCSNNKNALTEKNEEIVNVYYIDHTAPEKVDGVKVESNEGSIKLSWNPNAEKDIDHYTIYKKEREEEKFSVIREKCKLPDFTDTDVIQGRTYEYQIVAVDIAQNKGEASDAIWAKILPDTQAPVLHGMSPVTEKTIGIDTELSVLADDNFVVSKIEVEYRKKGDGLGWKTVGEIETDSKAVYEKLEWEKHGLEDCAVYEVRAIAYDGAYNPSQYVTREYTLDLTAPKIPMLEAKTGNFCIELDYSANTDDTTQKYEIYRKAYGESKYTCIQSLTDTTYTDTTVATNVIYSYKIRAYDEVGNYSESAVKTARANAIDTIAPVAVLPETVMAITGLSVCMDATASTDNARIMSYKWDFGDGTKATGAKPKHVYEESGEYTVSLTIKDEAGNEDSTFTTVIVLDAANNGITTVQILDEKDSAVAGASVYVKTSNDSSECIKTMTDNAGRVTLACKAGVYEICVFKAGYYPITDHVRVSNYERLNATYRIPGSGSNNVVCGALVTHRMELEEIIASGVDLSDPENMNTYTFEVELAFERNALPSLYWGVGKDGRGVRGLSHNVPSGNVGNATDGSPHGRGIQVCVVEPEDGPDVENYNKKTIMYLSTNQTVSWLKEMYSVDLGVVNVADSQFVIHDASATLNLPSGLSLAKTSSSNELIYHFDKLRGQESAVASWIVKGDAPGKYELEAGFHGVLAPFEESLDYTFVAEEEIESLGGKGIEIDVYPEDAVYNNSNYYINFVLTNHSGHDMYNVSTTFGEFVSPAHETTIYYKDFETKQITSVETHMQGRTFIIPSANKCSQVTYMKGGDTLSCGVLADGDSIRGTYTRQITSGLSLESYGKLVDHFVRELKGANLGVSVTVHPVKSHITRYIQYTTSGGISCGEDEEAEVIGDPIDVSTGAFTQKINALNVQGITMLALDASYNSLLVEDAGEMGYGFTHSYEQYIEKEQGGKFDLHLNQHSYIAFHSQEALDNVIYGVKTVKGIVLDDVEYHGDFVPDSGAIRGWESKKNKDGSYEIVDSAGITSKFDSNGKLIKVIQKDGKSVSVKTTEDKRVITDDLSGETLTLWYENQKVVKASDKHGREVSFVYDTNDNLIQFTDVLGKKTNLEYDSNHHIISMTDENGKSIVTNTYDKDGRVLKQTENGSDKVTTLSYEVSDGKAKVTTVTDRLGAVTTYEMDNFGNIIRQTNALGDTIEKLYDSYGNLLTEIAPDDSRVMYTYNDRFLRNTMYDTSGNATYFAYDDDGNMIQSRDGMGNTSKFTYNSKGQLVQSTINDTAKLSYTYNEDGQTKSVSTQGLGTIYYTYDANKRLASETDQKGNLTSYQYDEYGNVTKITDSRGNATYAKYNEAGWKLWDEDEEGIRTEYSYDNNGNLLSESRLEKTTTYAYDAANRLIKQTNPSGEETTYEYDLEGRVTKIIYPDHTYTEYTYDLLGNMISEIAPDKSVHTYVYDSMRNVILESYQGETTEYTYYGNGKIKTLQTSDNQKYFYEYDANWNLIQIIDQDNHTTKYQYDCMGNQTGRIDMLGNKMEAVYDDNNRMIKQIDALGNETSYRYDANGNCIYKRNALGQVYNYTYDACDNLIRSTTSVGGENITVSYEYDKKGRCIKTTDAKGHTSYVAYDEDDNPVCVTDAMGNEVKNTYDKNNQLISTENALGIVTENAYNKNGSLLFEKLKLSDGKDKTYAYSYDEKERLIQVIDPSGASTTQSFDEKGNLSKVTDAMGGITKYRYDETNRLIQETNAIGSNVNYTYNAKGLLATKENARGQKTEYTYDILGRITSVTDPDGTIRYTYDANGNVLTVSDKSGTIERTYDALNRVKTYTDCNGKTIEYGYDEIGNRISLTYPGGEIVRYTYDANGNTLTVTDAGNNVTRYTYNDCDYITRVQRGDGSSESYEYNAAGYVTKKTNTLASGKVLSCNEYSYDENANITNITGVNPVDMSMLNDAVMTYDKDNRLITYNGEEVTYDADGNMLHGPLNGRMADFVYDSRNRLIKVRDADGEITEYGYDAENTRISTTKNDTKTVYVVDKEANFSQILTETVYGKNIFGGYTEKKSEKTYTYGIGLISEKNNKGTLYYHYNHLGSTTDVTDAAGSLRYHIDYGTYGEITGISDGRNKDLIVVEEGQTIGEALCKTLVDANISFLYNGQYGVTTDTNGLYYMRARYYNTDIKRFINRDVVTGEIENSQSLNRYCYVQGNPVTNTDPFGLSPLGVLANIDWRAVGHFALDLAGLFFDAADIINGIWYSLEGNMEYAAASYVAAIPVVGGALGGAIKVLGGSEKALKAAKIVSKLTNLAGIGAMIAGPAIGACIDGKISASQIPGYIKQNNKLGLAFGALGLGALGYKGLKKANKLSDASQATKVANKVNEVSKTERKVADAGRTSGNKLELNLQFFASEGSKTSGYGNYTFKEGIDVDLRGKGNYQDALNDALNKTGIPKEDFNVTKWGRDKNGKSFPVEWRANNGAEVSIDLGHSPYGEAPTVPHVGWQTGGKRGNGGAMRGHIFVDDVPYNR